MFEKITFWNFFFFFRIQALKRTRYGAKKIVEK